MRRSTLSTLMTRASTSSADLDDVLDLLHVILAELRDVDEAVDVAFERNECSEGCDLGDRAFDEIADLEAAVDFGPWIVLRAA